MERDQQLFCLCLVCSVGFLTFLNIFFVQAFFFTAAVARDLLRFRVEIGL